MTVKELIEMLRDYEDIGEVRGAFQPDHWPMQASIRDVVYADGAVYVALNMARDPGLPAVHHGAERMTPLERAARRYKRAQDNRDAARDVLADAVRDAVAAGMTEVDAARIGGVDRMTIRKWLGK